MRKVVLEKVTVNIGVGASGEVLQNAKDLLQKMTGRTPVTTIARNRNPTFKVRKGDAIGVKVTLRGEIAVDIVKRALEAVDHAIPAKSFDSTGNVAFGVREYIDVPGVKYDPKLGMMGFDVCLTLKMPGARVSRRRIAARRLPRRQYVTREEAMKFMQEKFEVSIEDAKA